MPLREAIPFLKDAVTRATSSGPPSTYTFHEGRMFAQGEGLLASYPMPHILGTFGMAVRELEGAIARMPSEPIISAGDGELILTSGRIRSSIDLFSVDPPTESADVDGWPSCPSGLWPAMAAAQPFVARDGGWQRTMCLMHDRVCAASSVSCASVQVNGLEVEGDQAGLLDTCVDYLVDLPPPERWSLNPKRLVWFSWPSGAWVRCQLSAVLWPSDTAGEKIIDKVLAMAASDGSAPIDVNEGWREAFEDIAALVKLGGDGECVIKPDGLFGRSQHGKHVVEFATGVARESRWGIKSLVPVIEAALEWRPDADRAALFVGTNVRGAVIGRQA